MVRLALLLLVSAGRSRLLLLRLALRDCAQLVAVAGEKLVAARSARLIVPLAAAASVPSSQRRV